MNFLIKNAICIAIFWVFSIVFNVKSYAQTNAIYKIIDSYNVEWTTPSVNSKGSMPLGNGDIGVNCWAEKGGVIYLYLSKNDAWDENCRLLKLGKVKLNIYPDPFINNFKQILRLIDGSIVIKSITNKDSFQIRIWADANNPAVRIETFSSTKHSVSVELDNWRKEKRALNGDERYSAYGLADNKSSIYVYPDTVLNNDNQLTWLHYNQSSIWQLTLQQQGLSSLISKQKDPLLRRAFGCAIKGNTLKKKSNNRMVSTEAFSHHFSIYAYTTQAQSIVGWNTGINNIINTDLKKHFAINYHNHLTWWKNYWSKSYISVSGSSEADTVMRGYLLQRFVAACSNRGKYPNKFNGSLFTVDSMEASKPYDADFREWGGPYWLQNTRLIYWPMLAAGNFEMMKPFFEMYTNALTLGTERTGKYFNHAGAYFPETMYFWGAYTMDDYGWDRDNKPVDSVDNIYIRYHYEGGLEVAAMMLEYYRYTLDEAFLKQKTIPFIKQILLFYDKHYRKVKVNNQYIYRIEPAQSLETYPAVINPLPVISGLAWVLNELLQLPPNSYSSQLRLHWDEQRKSLPAIPIKTINGQQRLVPAEEILAKAQNTENAELYAVFPFRLFGVGKEGLEIAINTFNYRPFPGSEGWRQDDIHAAYLGLTNQAKQLLVKRMSDTHKGSRFPGFWGPNFDWIPDQDHASNGLSALQTMLVQYAGKKIIVFPAWPKEWDVSFKLHTADKTLIEAVYKNGKIVTLKTMPAGRLKDVIVSEMK